LHPLEVLRFRNRSAPVDRKPHPEDFAGGRTAKLARLEAALFVAETALSARRLAQDAALADPGEAHRLVEELNVAYDRSGCTFRVERVATGYQLLTRPEFAPWLDKVHHRQARLRLSTSAMETLAIVAYRQPLTRADVETVRGVQCSDLLKQLMDRGLVRIVGEDDALGRPFLYGTTRTFLELFGLRALDDLPQAAAFRPHPGTDAGMDQTVEAALDAPPSESA
jgi:segregation and condensation protein B